MNNNIWEGADGSATVAERYVDGVCLEHFSPTDPLKVAIAGKPYGNLGHRRLLAIANQEQATQWAAVQGVTHVSDQSTYGTVTPPPIPFHRLTDRTRTFGRTTVAAVPSAGMATDQKRGSKFTLTDVATVLTLRAYLDGKGDPDPTRTTGEALVRMALYRDAGGVPAALIAQSPTAHIVVKFNAQWVRFNLPPTALDPGDYWIVLHTGGDTGIARNYGDGAANWFGNNTDPFGDNDGSSNPFGTGVPGTVTLSVYATYSMGH